MAIPVYLKNDPQQPRPADPQYYLITGSGMFLCRNEAFWESDVPTTRHPRGLAEHQTFCRPHFPLLGTAALEYIVGFFDRVYQARQAESVVLLLWDTLRSRYRLWVPQQESKVWESWSGVRTAMDVAYQIPVPLPPGHLVLGDIHCHCDFGAYSSWTDKHDETYRDGVHVIVGHIEREPPDFHLELSIDGHRFALKFGHLFRGYRRRRRVVPQRWLDQVKIRVQRPLWSQTSTYASSYQSKGR